MVVRRMRIGFIGPGKVAAKRASVVAMVPRLLRDDRGKSGADQTAPEEHADSPSRKAEKPPLHLEGAPLAEDTPFRKSLAVAEDEMVLPSPDARGGALRDFVGREWHAGGRVAHCVNAARRLSDKLGVVGAEDLRIIERLDAVHAGVMDYRAVRAENAMVPKAGKAVLGEFPTPHHDVSHTEW